MPTQFSPQTSRWQRARLTRIALPLAMASVASLALTACGGSSSGSASGSEGKPIIGLITKTDTNPFFVKMKQGATEEAAKQGVTL